MMTIDSGGHRKQYYTEILLRKIYLMKLGYSVVPPLVIQLPSQPKRWRRLKDLSYRETQAYQNLVQPTSTLPHHIRMVLPTQVPHKLFYAQLLDMQKGRSRLLQCQSCIWRKIFQLQDTLCHPSPTLQFMSGPYAMQTAQSYLLIKM